jgi:SAM-dependent methyltransferase
MNVVTRILESPRIYQIWQAPFAEDKFAPLIEHNDLRRVRRVLDVGCGPGTNVRHFPECDYLGLDINPNYVSYARRRFRNNFLVADATQFTAPVNKQFDFILLNSILHHADADNVRKILSNLSCALTNDGYIHIIELVLPEHRSLPRLLASWDRGRFARPLNCWRELFGAELQIVLFEPFTVQTLGIPLWSLVYCKGRAK